MEVYLNFQSDITTKHTLISSLPSSKLNSVRFMTVETGTTGNIIVRKSETHSFCYYCYYFITVTPVSTEKKAEFDIEVRKSRDDGEESE